SGFNVESERELVTSLTALFTSLTTTGRTLTSARMALFVEAIHDREVREALFAGWSILSETIRAALARLGASDPEFGAEVIAVCFEGLFLRVLGRDQQLDPERHLTIAVRGALAG